MENIIVIPAYEPDEKLEQVTVELLKNNFTKIIIINDGSDSSFDKYFDFAEDVDEIILLKHKQNKGKGCALKTAFKYIVNNLSDSNYSGVITVDADGQHIISDIKKISDMLKLHTNKLILGARAFEKGTIPQKSYVGNKTSSKFLEFFYNIYVADSQTGLRGIPFSELLWMSKMMGSRYEYELNMLIQTKKKDINILQVPIQTIYFNNNEKSHFKPTKDTSRILFLFFANLFFYIFISALSVIIDILMFFAINTYAFKMLNEAKNILFSTIIARITSSICNYSFNNKYFKSKGKVSKKTLRRYYTLVLLQLFTSAGLTILFNLLLTNVKPIFIKIPIDIILAVISYQIQLRWVFCTDKKTYGLFCRAIRRVFRLTFPKFEVFCDKYEEPIVLVGHHQNLKGPVTSMVWLNFHVRIWALDVFFEFKSCFYQYYNYTFTKRANMKKPIAAIAAFFSAIFVSVLIKSLKGIKVHRNKKIIYTMADSLNTLLDDDNIIIFPDIQYSDTSDKIEDIYTGFLNLEKMYFKKTKKHLPFIPVKINYQNNTITLLEPIFFKDDENFAEGKKRVAKEICSKLNE